MFQSALPSVNPFHRGLFRKAATLDAPPSAIFGGWGTRRLGQPPSHVLQTLLFPAVRPGVIGKHENGFPITYAENLRVVRIVIRTRNARCPVCPTFSRIA